MTITPSSLAAGNVVGIKNEQFAVSAEVISRRIAVIATYDPLKISVVDEVPKQVFSGEDAGDQTGFGFMMERLVSKAFAGSQGVECWMIPQAEEGGAVVSTGEIDWTGSTGVVAGTMYLYIAGDQYQITITDGMTIEELSDAVVAKINAKIDAPVIASKTLVTFETVLTAKSKGPWGNDIDISFNWGPGEVLPAGIVYTITDMASGTGIPDIDDALNGMGIGDGQNEKFFTEVIHGYGQDSSTLDKISVYNGIANDFVGNYKKEVGRPFRSLTGDTAAGTAGLTALIAIGEGRKEIDRTNDILAMPGCPAHPSEIAAWSLGKMAAINSIRAEETYINVATPFIPGAIADRWTSDYDNRDLAVKAGISTSFVKSGVVTLQNIVTFYHPASVPQSSNAYRAQRNISIYQNILSAFKANFERDKWQGISIVEDKTAVSNQTSAEKARDVDDVIDDLVDLANVFAGNAWLYNASFTIANLSVTLRSGLTGFDIIFPIIPSGEGGIFNTDIKTDISIAILL